MANKPSVTTGSWSNTGTEPTGAKKTTGWVQDERPPYQYFNWFWNVVSVWNSFFDNQFNFIETTISDDTYTTPSDATGYTSAQAYIDALPSIINHDISILLSGSGYAGNTLTISNKTGVGSITIREDTVSAPTDNIATIDLDDISCKFFASNITFDGQTTNKGLDCTDCTDVDVEDATFTDCTTMIYANGITNVTVSKSTPCVVGSGNDNGLFAENGARIYSGQWSNGLTNLVTGQSHTAEDSGEIFIVNPNQPISSDASNPVSVNFGGVLHPYYSLNDFGSASNYTITISNATQLAALNGVLSSFGKHIAKDRKVTVNIGTATANLDLEIFDFTGGGELEIVGNGTGNTAFNVTQELLIENNDIQIDIKDLSLASTGFIAGVKVLNNNGYVFLNNMNISKGAAGGTGVEIVRSNGVVIGGISAINFTTNDPVTAISVVQSLCMISNATGNGSTYGVQATFASVVGNASALTGTTANTNTDAYSFINKA